MLNFQEFSVKTRHKIGFLKRGKDAGVTMAGNPIFKLYRLMSAAAGFFA